MADEKKPSVRLETSYMGEKPSDCDFKVYASLKVIIEETMAKAEQEQEEKPEHE